MGQAVAVCLLAYPAEKQMLLATANLAIWLSSIIISCEIDPFQVRASL